MGDGGPGITNQSQMIWSQRIRKEEGVNTKVNPGGFSVRAAIRSVDVPKRFKPGHIDPTRANSTGGFDPNSKLAAEVHSRVEESRVPLRDRIMFPETCAQDHGWYQKDPAHGPDRGGRTSIAGALPRAGIGWVGHELEKLLPGIKADSPAKANQPIVGVYGGEHRHASSEYANALRKVRSQRSTEGGTQRSSGHHHSRPPKVAVTGHPSLPGGSCLAIAGRTASMPALSSRPQQYSSAAAIEQSNSEGLEIAMERSRMFLNRHPKADLHYKPLGNSDVSAFCDAYTKCWGGQLFGKSSGRGQ